MGRYSYGQDDEVTPALKLNGTKLLNTRAPGDDRQHLHAVADGASTNSGSGYNSFFNTFGRELAFERDVVTELDIPGVMLTIRRKPGAFRASASPGSAASATARKGPYTNRNKVFEFTDNVSWIRGRHSFKVGGNIRFDQFNQVGNQFARGGFQFDGNATVADRLHAGDRDRVRRLPARLPAHCPNRRWRWR